MFKLAFFLPVFLVSCAALEPLLNTSVQAADPVSGEVVETTLGDAIADNAEEASSAIGTALGAVNPMLGLLAAGAAGALLSGARRKKASSAE